MDTSKLNHNQIIKYYKEKLIPIYGSQSTFSKKIERKWDGNYNNVVNVVFGYINKKPNQFNVQITRDNVYRAFVVLLLTFNEEHESSRVIRGNGYNRVLTQLLNDNDIIDVLRGYKLHTLYVNDSGHICFGDYIVFSNYNKDVDVMNSDKVYDYLIRKHNNKHYIMIADNEIKDEVLQYEQISNGFGGISYMLPINHKDNIQTRHIKGNDWIKEYIYKPKVGYLYFLSMCINGIKTYKVGITINLDNRFSKYEKQFITDNHAYKVSMLEAAVIERYFHHKYYSIRDTTFTNTDLNISGITELYHEDLHNRLNPGILKDALNQLDEENYPIPSHMIEELINTQNKTLGIE